MSGSRKRCSKWDSKEEHNINVDCVKRCSKWDSKEEHNISVDCVKYWKTTPWDGDETYKMKMSPALDDWRQRNHRHSPKSDWSRYHRSRSWSRSYSRSRSRSPVRGIRQQSGFHERTRNRSEVSTQLCKDFIAGRCRRGSQCQFLHQDIQSHENGWDNRKSRAGASRYFTPNNGKEYLIKSGRSPDCCTDYMKGNCRRGASCRFAHDGVSNGFSRVAINEVSRERENKKRNRERDGEHEARRSNEVPCKYFAAGNCRNGKYCRFSHHIQARASPERSCSDKGGWGQSSTSVDKLCDGAKLRGVDASLNVKKTLAGPKWSHADVSNDVDESWTGSKWSDTGAYSGATKLSKDTNGKMGTSEQRFSDLSLNEIWQHDYDASGKNSETRVHYKTVDVDKDEGIPRNIENAGVSMGAPEPRGAEESLGDMEMSPDWNYRIHSSVRKEHSHSSEFTVADTSLPAYEKNITVESSGRVCEGLAALQPISTEKSNFQQDHMMRGNTAVAFPCDSNAVSRNSSISHIDLNFSTNILPMPSFDHPGPSSSSLTYSNLHAVGQSQVAIPPNEINLKVMQNGQLFQEEKQSNTLNIGDINTLHGNSEIQSTQSMGSNEQLTQLTKLSASLAQLFGKRQQLPLLHVALNAHDAMQVTSFPNSGGPVELDSVPTVQPDQAIKLPKQYDPISEPVKKQDKKTKPLGISEHPVAQKNNADGKPELMNNKLSSSLVVSTNGGDFHNDHSSKRELDFDSHMPNQLEPVVSTKLAKENGGVEETKKAEEDNKNGPSENVDADDMIDDGKKSKDGKGIRAFKFALVEFVKDILKPTWKEGQIGREAYKDIVKKVVDKVTATLQGTNIPQTPQKIDQYLSFSKPKLSKLVQAYVEKFQRS